MLSQRSQFPSVSRGYAAKAVTSKNTASNAMNSPMPAFASSDRTSGAPSQSFERGAPFSLRRHMGKNASLSKTRHFAR